MAVTYDHTNQIINFTASGDTFTPPAAPFGRNGQIPVDNIILEGASTATTLTDLNGNVLAVMAVEGFYLPIRRWVNGLKTPTVGAGANLRVYLKKTDF